MDGAAKDAEKLAQRILPDRPYHLSLSFDRQFPRPDGWWFTGPSAPLQYMTYISAAQRGILTTRAAFEICDEPDQMPAKILAKGEARKKLSLMDYHNRKKSESPVANESPAKVEAKTNGTAPAKRPPSKEHPSREDVRAAEKTETPRQRDTRLEKPPSGTNGERSKPSQEDAQPETESQKPPKVEKEKADGPSPSKKAKKVSKIPPLLSPTLPPVVEAALAVKERAQTGSKSVPGPAPKQAADSSGGARKTIVAAPAVRGVEAEEKPSRPSKIVTFKLKKANAKRAKELLSLPSKSAKDALKKERSTSAEAAPLPAPAKKRPRPADDVPQETAKRTKTAGEVAAARPAAPATPLKPAAATAMSRVASSQSQGNTPAATTGLTPGNGDNRPPTRSEPLDPKTLAQAESYKERHAEYQRLGGKLKHARDDLCRDRGGPGGMAPADERRATALHFEMVLAYMVAFHSLNQARTLERKACDISAWESLLPHLAELRGRVQGIKALKALAVQMHVLCLEQITNALATLDPAAAAGSFARWAKHSRNRAAMWQEANAMWERVDDPRMRTVVGPWTSIEDAVAAVLAVMRRWADRESVRWQPEVHLKGEREKEKEKDRDRDREKDRERERERDRDRDRERDRERDRPRPSLNGVRH
ncbi:933cf3f1-3745-4207-b88e-54f7431a3d76 [Thermothielavioides terrestris]|uniref:933cf3f1-3745-4207-b88e-54f7431a3d76 n=1 Tax=Thermothielavioides terrestris TaxID=2587410 RepID=A0A3S4F888_9PEZI|nr:933cf3f1-3745-4207-b88e-54f7431a3d76 [Thermothielavioides terrestris]